MFFFFFCIFCRTMLNKLWVLREDSFDDNLLEYRRRISIYNAVLDNISV
jgi:hypothetical protein